MLLICMRNGTPAYECALLVPRFVVPVHMCTRFAVTVD